MIYDKETLASEIKSLDGGTLKLRVCKQRQIKGGNKVNK